MSQLNLSLIQANANTNSVNAASAFSEIGWLHEVITTLAFDPNSFLASKLQLLPPNLQQPLMQELSRRTWALPSQGKIRPHIGTELLRVALTRSHLIRYFWFNNKQATNYVYWALDQHAAKHHIDNINAVYAYEDEAATTFAVAKKQGIYCLYDLPIMFYRSACKIQQEEANNFPDLAPALAAVEEPNWKLERKEQEITLADHIFVASSVTERSLTEAGVPTEKISVIPYGAPTSYFQPKPKPDLTFRALFVGSVSPRKGVHYLLRAWQELKLPGAELLFVGPNILPQEWLARYGDCFRYVPSVPHQRLNEYYSLGSIFVFPSLVEGFGLVLLEAMACGIPIITTPNTAGPDIITEGVEGFIVSIRDVEALKEKLGWCYEHPQELAEMGRAARRKAEQLTWDLYRQRLVSQVQKVYQQVVKL